MLTWLSGSNKGQVMKWFSASLQSVMQNLTNSATSGHSILWLDGAKLYMNRLRA